MNSNMSTKTFSAFWDFCNFPNFLTLSRVLIIPLVYSLLLSGHFTIAMQIFLLSLLTDFFDGYVARRFSKETLVGAILDPVCDKFVVLIYLALIFEGSNLIPWWFVLLTFARNISQLMSIPILMWWLKIPFYVKPKRLPKWASGISFTILFFGLYLQHGSIYHVWFFPEMNAVLQWVLIPISSYMEAYILVTYLPRLIQIARRQHDTFE